MELAKWVEHTEKNTKTYLKLIHQNLDSIEELTDLHTFLYHMGLEKCPICDYSFVTKIEFMRQDR